MDQFVDFFSQGFHHILEGLSFIVSDPNGYKWPCMWLIGALLIILAIKKNVEPALLLPMGFGAILMNISPLADIALFDKLYEIGIETDAMPLLLFIGIGAMIDFGPLLSNPKVIFFGAAAQFGIFLTLVLAALYYTMPEAASIAIIGAADGPTTIIVARQFLSGLTGGSGSGGGSLIGPITVVAYSYMALVPIVQPAAIRLVTTKAERRIRMDYNPSGVSKRTKIIFPIIVTLIAGLVAPASVSLVGCLMFGNLLRECLVLQNLSETASKTLANLITLFLGITIATQMTANAFLTIDTLIIMGLGLFAFTLDTMGGVMFAKGMNLFSKNKINPMIGGAGISAFPMSARVIQKMGLKADPQNHLLMHAVGSNVSGQIASVIAGGIILTLLPQLWPDAFTHVKPVQDAVGMLSGLVGW